MCLENLANIATIASLIVSLFTLGNVIKISKSINQKIQGDRNVQAGRDANVGMD
jgi:hypothetical protein